MRIVIYSIIAIVSVIALKINGDLRLAMHYKDCLDVPNTPNAEKLTAMENAKALIACVDARSGIMESFSFKSMKMMFSDLPSTPCNYVGTWRSIRMNSMYQILLEANGQFLAVPVKVSEPGAREVTGSWSVAGSGENQKMVWLYDEGQVWPPDINPILEISQNSFVLIEQNGSRTNFTRLNARQPQCN